MTSFSKIKQSKMPAGFLAHNVGTLATLCIYKYTVVYLAKARYQLEPLTIF